MEKVKNQNHERKSYGFRDMESLKSKLVAIRKIRCALVGWIK